MAVSVEIRKEKGESFSPWRGLLREYELMYVVGDERDVIRLRTNYRRDPRLSLSDQDHAGADAEDVRGHGV